MQQIQSSSEFENLLKDNSQFFLLKHSNTCPISQAGYDEFSEFAGDNTEIPCFYLIVQEARPLSNEIAEKFHVKHESPQAILFNREDVAWHASHWDITVKKLTEALKEAE